MADNPANAEPEVLTVAELATKLRRGQRQTREALIRGEIPGAHKIGSRWRISTVVIERLLHAQEPSGTPAMAAEQSPFAVALAKLPQETQDAMGRALAAEIVAALDTMAAEGRRRIKEREEAAAGSVEPGKDDSE
jgi:hypothetical protein